MSHELKEMLIRRILSAVFEPEQIEYLVESNGIGVPWKQMVKEAPKFNDFSMQLNPDDVFLIATIANPSYLGPGIPFREVKWSSCGLCHVDVNRETIEVPYVHTKTKITCIMKIPVSYFPSVVEVMEYTKALKKRSKERNDKVHYMYRRLWMLTPKQICSALNIKLENYILNDLKLTEEQIKTIQEKLQ